MINVSRFDPKTAYEAHLGTILASPVFDPKDQCPIRNQYGYLDKDGARMEVHSHPQAEYYIVFEGAGFVEIDGELKEVFPGEVIEIPRNAKHTMQCKGNSPFIWAAFWWD